MSWFPSIPGWDGVHPALVHFPIALLLVAPLLLIVSLFVRQGWRPWAIAALSVMALGTIAAWLAVGTGHAAGQLVDKTPALERAIARHEALGVITRNTFTLLTLIFGALLLVPMRMKKPLPEPWRIATFAVFALAYLGLTTLLTNTADRGGRLVHELGVQAQVGSAAAPAPNAPLSHAGGND